MTVCAKLDTSPSASDAPVPLEPALHPIIAEFLGQTQLVRDLVAGFGSPLNFIFPNHIEDNLNDFQAAYKKLHMRGQIFYTNKPCKSEALMRRASILPMGADVSSAKSLAQALKCGFAPERIEATGPKNSEYLLSCLQLDVLINVDSMAELQTLELLHRKLQLTRKARIMVRLGGFSSSRVTFTPHDGTFGIHVNDIPAALDWLSARKDSFEFIGFSFHLSVSNPQERLMAMENQLDLTFLALQKGFKPKAVNIGGGFSIQYARSREQWQIYTEELKRSVLGKRSSLTWDNSGLGYREQHGIISGAPRFMDHCPPLTKGAELCSWLEVRSPALENCRLADVIRDSLLELYIEPGRGMLDQCGVTLGQVAFTKPSAWGEELVGLEMNRTNLNATQLTMLTEPVLIPADESPRAVAPQGVFYTGNLCLSYDMLKYNRSFPAFLPQTGDIVAFANTAPYIMDFAESDVLMQPLAQKIAISKVQDKFTWTLDDKYLPLSIQETR